MTYGELTCEEKLKKAKIQVQIKNPFFAFLSMSIRFHEVDAKDLQSASMGIDARGNCYYCKEFIDKITDEELVGVLLHETLHLGFLHMLRRGTRDHPMFNVAIDIAVNNILVNNGYRLPAGGLIPSYNQIDLGSGCILKDLDKKNAEQIYDELDKQVKKISQKMKGIFKMFDDHMEGAGEEEEDGKGKKKKGILKGSKMPLSTAQQLALEKEWTQKAQDAATLAKMKGNLPNGMELFLGKLHEAKINWRTLLRQQIQNAIPYDQEYSVCSKKSRCAGYYIPGYLKDSIKVLVAVDTSGSIGEKERVDFISEICGMAKAFKTQIEMIFLTHDTQVHDDIKMENGKIAKIQEMKFHGGGGTSHEPVMDYITKKHRDTKLAVFLTDGYSDLNEFDMNKFRFNKIFVISEGGSADQLKSKRCKTIKLEKSYK
jgi:predicted metal-dependent peptidase